MGWRTPANPFLRAACLRGIQIGLHVLIIAVPFAASKLTEITFKIGANNSSDYGIYKIVTP